MSIPKPAHVSPIEADAPTIAAFEIVESARKDPYRRFDPGRLGAVDRHRARAIAELVDADAKRDILLAEQDRIIRALSEVDATIHYLNEVVAAADNICDRG